MEYFLNISPSNSTNLILSLSQPSFSGLFLLTGMDCVVLDTIALSRGLFILDSLQMVSCIFTCDVAKIIPVHPLTLLPPPPPAQRPPPHRSVPAREGVRRGRPRWIRCPRARILGKILTNPTWRSVSHESLCTGITWQESCPKLASRLLISNWVVDRQLTGGHGQRLRRRDRRRRGGTPHRTISMLDAT